MRTRQGGRPAPPTVALADRLRAVPAGLVRRALASSWVLGGLVLLVSWSPILTTPRAGLDPSWALSLQMAAVEHLHWGTEFIFGYGPLGFLRFPFVANAWPAVLSGLYLVAIKLALAVSVVWIARRRFNLPIALALAFVTVSLSGSDAALPLAFIWCAVAIAEDPPTHHRLVLFGGGALSALEVLVKVNEGLVIAGMCAVAAIMMEGRRSRNVLSFGLTFLACLLTFWFAAGQGIANADDFVVGSAQVLRGYSSAMMLPGPAPAGWAAAALIIWALAVLAALFTGRGLPAPRRLGLVLLVLGLGFGAWKEGFVRPGPGHLALFFTWMLAPWIALRWRERYPWTLAGFVAVTILYFAAIGARPQDRWQPVDNAKIMVMNLRAVFDPARRDSVRTQALKGMQSVYGLDQRTLALLQGKTVDVSPWETGIVWAYGLNWKPQPMPQTYAAYTPWLDERNAAVLASSEGPQRILRHLMHPNAIADSHILKTSLDDRYAVYDSPAATLAMLCHFDALRTTQGYQVLGRVRDRCGPPRFLSSTSASYGQDVGVPRPPRPHDIVFVRIAGAAPSGIEAVRTFLYRAEVREIVFDGKFKYRVVPSVLGDGLILDAPPGVDFPGRFALAPNARTVRLRKDLAPLSPERQLRFDFYAMRVRPE
jgi:hypothetical protein